MSQSSLLEDVQSWDYHKCSEQVAEVLPKLIVMYTNGCSLETKVSLLGVMVKSFVPVIDVDHLEPQFMSQVFPETQKIYDVILTTIISALEEEAEVCNTDIEETLQAHLQMIIDLLTPMESTLLYIVQHSEGGVQPSSVRSAPVIVANIIRRSFDHCKESNIIYGGHFEALSSQLSSFFKKTYTLQKALMAVLDLVQVSHQGQEMSELTTQVSAQFHDICMVISNMDTSLMASTWKFLVKFVTKHKECLDDSILQIPEVVSSLCTEIRSHFKHCLTQAPLEPTGNTPPSQGREQKVFSKTVKICGLLAKMLIHLLKEFDKIHEDCSETILELVQYLHSHSPPSLTAPRMRSEIKDELCRSFLVCIEPLVQQIVPCRKFYDALLSPTHDFNGDVNPFGHLMTLITILRLLPQTTIEIQNHYHAIDVFPEDRPRESIVRCVLKTVTRCYPEFTLPVHLPAIVKPQSTISLHEYVVTHLSGFVATVTADQFNRTERCLLQGVMSDSFTEALVAMDVWCFVARYGTAELCAYHCQLLAGLIKSFPSANQCPVYLHLCLQRLVPLMADASKVEFTKRFPVEENISLWSGLTLHTFSSEHRREVCQTVSQDCLQCFGDWSISKDVDSLHKLFQSMTNLSKLCHQFEAASPPVPPDILPELTSHLLALLHRISPDAERFEPIAPVVYELSAHLILGLKPQELEMVLKAILPTSSSLQTLQFSCLSLLNKLGKLNLSNHPQQQDLLPLISQAFARSLSHDSPVIQHLAMVAFSRFAEETVHESLVPECLQDQCTQDKVVEFLNQNPAAFERTKPEVALLKQQASILEQSAKAVADPPTIPETTNTDTSPVETNGDMDMQEPESKKAKLDSEKFLLEKLSEISDSVQALDSLLSNLGYYPSWLTHELDHIINTVTEMKHLG